MNRWLASIVAGALVIGGGAAHAASSALSPEANAQFLADNAHKPGVQVMRDGMQYRILKTGYGQRPGNGDLVTVYYDLSLINGKHVEGTEPDFPAQMPVANLIPGWKEALRNMRVGDHWQLFIPSTLAYGPRGTDDGSIPPNQTLVFDMELVKVFTPPEKPHDDDKDQQGQGGGQR